MDQRPLITAQQAGALLGLSARAVYDIPDDDLPRYRVGAGRATLPSVAWSSW